MSKLILLYLTLLVSILFILLPNTGITQKWFLFSEVKLTFKTHLYFICEHFVLIVMAHIIKSEYSDNKFELSIFFYLMIIDLVDYLLNYNEIWFRVGEVPVSFNTTACLIFGLTILNKWIKSQ